MLPLLALTACVASVDSGAEPCEPIAQDQSAFSAEICDGIDNDGDFLIDEDAADTLNGGACAPKITKSLYDNHEYLFVDKEFTWDTANAVCQGQGFGLIKVDDASENSYMTSFLVSPLRAWMGLSDQAAEGTWTWSDGSLPGYSNWIQGQPVNDLGSEDCAIHYHTSGQWAAVNCAAKYRSMCELADPISWTLFQGVSVNGTQLTKISGMSWDAGAASTTTITGDGFVQFSTLENDQPKMVGLNALAAGENPGLKNFNQIDFAIVLGSDGSVRISENASYLSPTTLLGNYVPGDVFRVEVFNGKVRYLRNGALMYSSTKPIAGALRVDANLGGSGGATVSNVRFAACAVGDTQCIKPGLWTDASGVLARGDIVQAYGWTRSVSSIQEVTGNASIEFSTPDVQPLTGYTQYKHAGLREKSINGQSISNIRYGIRFARVNGVPKAIAWLNGNEAWACGGTRYQDYVEGDLFRFDIQGTTVTYFKNNTAFCTLTNQPALSAPHVLDLHFDHEHTRFENLSIVQQ